MRVKSVVIDGFKSYAHRQELSNLDHHFNAITGLNGSGKSNVFDAICFVMGLKNIAKARVERQEELIFKNGKAGIVRAAVTIVFDNSDPATAHPDYKTENEITITRQIDTGLRQRFFFNGRLRDQETIRDFFMRASLNIENPHFLVQQGQIHRLIGMKEKDILGFIEEAAGTAIFDMTRKKAEMQMRQKDKRLNEINSSIDEEIRPMLQKIEEQEEENQKLQRIEQDIVRLRNFKAAYDLWTAHRAAAEAKSKLDTVNGRMTELRQEIAELDRTIQEKERLSEKLEQDMNEPTATVEKYEIEVSTLKTSLTRLRSALTQSQKQCNALEKEVQKNENEFLRAKEKFENFNSSSENTIQQHEELRTQIKAKHDEIAQLQQAIRLQKGGVTAGAGGVSIAEEKSALEKQLSRLGGDLNRAQQSMSSLDEQINQQRRNQQRLQQQQNEREQLLERARRDLTMAEEAYRPYEAVRKNGERMKGSLSEFNERRQELWRSITRDYSICAPMSCGNEAIGRQYADQIFGRVAQLVEVRDETNSFALSVGASNSALTRVVVTTGVVAQALVEQGNLNQRTSFMPLDSVQVANQHGQQVLNNKLAAARQIAADTENDGNGWAELAMNLISFEPQYQPIMEKVFGNFLVCSSIRVARRVADDNNCKMKAVTVDGDVVEPSGLMTGGSRGNAFDTLGLFVGARPLLDSYNKAEQDFKQMQIDSQQYERDAGKIHQLGTTVEQKKHAVEQLEYQIQNSPFAAVEAAIQKLIAEKNEQERVVNAIPKNIETIKNRLNEIAKSENMDSAAILKEFEQKRAAAQRDLTKYQEELEKGNDLAEKEGQQRDALQGKMDALDGTLKEKKADLATARAEEAKLTEEVQITERNQQERTALLVAAKQKLESLKEQYSNTSKELGNARDDKAELIGSHEKSITEQKSTATAHDNAVSALAAEEKKGVLSSFLTPQIRNTLGDPNGDFYFEDEHRTQQTLHELQEGELLIHSLTKKVNRNQLATLEQRKAENRKLVEQRDALIEDKTNIISSILKIESEKWSKLDEMVRVVSDHFGRLFHTCLDYATCRLQEKRDPDDQRLIGLEVKVAFNGKEKAGLTELSGGQRSLLALCLILAILKVHRAPIYILDEVDAALDPSHTQNLGKMLKEHFADAQFLLVSLKDGMFSSANVIYEVRNTQGFSEVTRKANTNNNNNRK